MPNFKVRPLGHTANLTMDCLEELVMVSVAALGFALLSSSLALAAKPAVGNYGNGLRCLNLMEQSVNQGAVSIDVETPYPLTVNANGGGKKLFLIMPDRIYALSLEKKSDQRIEYFQVKPDLPHLPFYLKIDRTRSGEVQVTRSLEKFAERPTDYRTMVLAAVSVGTAHDNPNVEMMVETRDVGPIQRFKADTRNRVHLGLKKLAQLLKQNPAYGRPRGDSEKLDSLSNSMSSDADFSPIDSLIYGLKECESVDDSEIKTFIAQDANFKKLKAN